MQEALMDPKLPDPHATSAGDLAAPAGPEPATSIALWPTFLRRTLAEDVVLTCGPAEEGAVPRPPDDPMLPEPAAEA
jgi:hypothetical protein